MKDAEIELFVEQIMKALGEEIKEIIKQAVESEKKPSLEQLEFLVRHLLLRKAREVLQGIVEILGTGYKGVSIACECRGLLRFRGNIKKYVKTILGEINAKRAYYRCSSCGRSIAPLDDELGIGKGHASVGLKRVISLAGVTGSFHGAPKVLAELAEIKASAKQVQRITEEVAISARGAQKSHSILPSLDKTERAYISCDGAMVNTTKGWREIKVGAVYNDAKEGKRYVSLVGKAAKFGSVLRRTGMAVGVWDCKEVIFIGDGAPWIRKQARINFPQAMQIVDFYHVKEHITECANKVFSEATKKAKRWRKRCVSAIYTGGAEKLIPILQDEKWIRHDAVKDLLRYVRTNAARMRYPLYRAKGWQIGSGPVESACKQIVTQRLKLNAGMKWRVENADAIARLRCIWLSNAWDALWQRKAA